MLCIWTKTLLKICFTSAKESNYWAAGSNEIRRRKKKNIKRTLWNSVQEKNNSKCVLHYWWYGYLFLHSCFKLFLWKLMILASDTKAGGKEYILNFTHWCFKFLDAIRSSFRKIYDNKYSSQSTSLSSTKSDAAFILYD